MSLESIPQYPDLAYAPNNVLWWKLQKHVDKNIDFGAELKLASWLAFNVNVGDTVTMRELRKALGDAIPNDDEHLNRRLRELRKRDGWEILSNKDDGRLAVGEYRITKQGWHPGLGTQRAKSKGISASVRRRVLERDERCTVCGVGPGEAYPDLPSTRAVMTIGHIVPSDRGGSSSDLNNLRVECKICNEPVRQEIRVPERLEEILPDVRKLKKAEAQKLMSWLSAGQRSRDSLDELYDRSRKLGPVERNVLVNRLRVKIAGTP
ncbi:HNH endonuclease [Arthrobacter koreensis]|uniref:HNH endonuclease n=1 Tax=Arthrobacter koreensis TaxID=199136 RepID=UPI0036D87F34